MARYSNSANALNFEIVNGSKDIGKWKLYLSKFDSVIEDCGMEALVSALDQLDKELVNVIYVKNLHFFEFIGEHWFDWTNCEFFATLKDNTQRFFYLKLTDTIELREWNNFFKDVEEPKDFIDRLNWCRKNFKAGKKNMLSLNYFKFTLPAVLWDDIAYEHYLHHTQWSDDFRKELLPQSEDELELYSRIYKASYFFANPKFVDKVVENVFSYDISSSHIGFISRKLYPVSRFECITNDDITFDIIESKNKAWIGTFIFVNLRPACDLPIDLSCFGKMISDNEWKLTLTNVHYEVFKKLFYFEDLIPISFFCSNQQTLRKNIIKMVSDLYDDKQYFKKSDAPPFVKNIFKLRAELPFGQSIKNPCYGVELELIDNTFIASYKKENFEQIQKRLLNRNTLPLQVGIWTAAYSWAEEVQMILDIGIDNVVYGDTDCVKFIGEDGVKVVEQHNKRIQAEKDLIKRNKHITLDEFLGIWKFEGKLDKFKSLGIKWYLTDLDNKIEATACGADKVVLESYLKEQDKPFAAFNKKMKVDGLFITYVKDKINKTISLIKSCYITDNELLKLK